MSCHKQDTPLRHVWLNNVILIGGHFFVHCRKVFSGKMAWSSPFQFHPPLSHCMSSSFSCLSVASADRTTPSAFSSVRSCTLSNLSFVLVLFTPRTIRSLIREFFSVPNSRFTYLSQYSYVLVNSFSAFLSS